ncbi:MAG TPA: radical SAM protein [Burkholderiales bacterium]|nr:radical SAM protein [Burkholderiales bacterium]
MQVKQTLSISDHSREAAGLTYVYPVISRRAGGVSVGINLNPNNACNWRCIYCQVPNLKRGAAPAIDLQKLDSELRGFLRELLVGDFMESKVRPEARRLNDIAISGNGEPTSSMQFAEVVDLIAKVIDDCGLKNKIKLVLITNGSLMHRATVEKGLLKMKNINGEVWFKLDSATAAGTRRINGVQRTPEKTLQDLRIAVSLCPTWLQTCVFALDGKPPSSAERAAYLNFISDLKQNKVQVEGVLLYGLARPSMQPEAPRLSALPKEWLDEFAHAIRSAGLQVRVSP